MGTVANTMVIGDFPQLRLIAWNRDPHDVITGEETFNFYEQNWRFVDEKALLPHERDLIDRLTREYGRGILHI
ncbi:hypothetical protein [Undibacterium rugosum]|uniref:hypothetical protein n=1 Tax=Undibacterium rugosum TaxID=2762291 RepID=UPI001B844CD4|nr:hypothetical protein [Undibacterium rugosum]MBR7780315.1 hypothetical protein [Undibacterium rugosum]